MGRNSGIRELVQREANFNPRFGTGFYSRTSPLRILLIGIPNLLNFANDESQRFKFLIEY